MIERAVERPYYFALNEAIWMAFKPMIKIYLSIGCGFILSKKKILTPQLSKGISVLVLNIFVPCLVFNNIVSQIKDTDIKLFGVIVFSGFIYYMIGFGWGFVIRLVSPIPRAWFGGLLLCCMVNNCSDLPLAYVQTIGKNPKLPSDLAQKGQAYCVLIVIIFFIFTFNLGGTRLVAWDANRVDPRREEPTVPVVSIESVTAALRWVRDKFRRQDMVHGESSSDVSIEERKYDPESSPASTHEEPHEPYHEADHARYLEQQPTQQQQQLTQQPTRATQGRPYGSSEIYLARRPSLISGEIFMDAESRLSVDPSAPVAFQNMEFLSRQQSAGSKPLDDKSKCPEKKKRKWKAWESFKGKWFKMKSKNFAVEYVFNAVEDIFMPQMLSLIAGIAVCMIPWVRRVFVKGQYIKNFHDPPDGNPPLDFLMDFLSFFAGAQVPLGLMLLGGTIASLKPGRMVKGFWKTLVLIVIFKLAILPIIACAWIHRIRAIGWLAMDDAMSPIVLAVAAGTPSATIQIYLTLAWVDPTKESLELNCLAISLMAQYALLPISMTILMSYIIMHYV